MTAAILGIMIFIWLYTLLLFRFVGFTFYGRCPDLVVRTASTHGSGGILWKMENQKWGDVVGFVKGNGSVYVGTYVCSLGYVVCT